VIDFIPKSTLPPDLKRLYNEAFDILNACGIPCEPAKSKGTTSSRQCAAAAFLAVANVRLGRSWAEAGTPMERPPLRNKDIICYGNLHLGLKRSDGSYDDVYRRDLLHPIQAGLVIQSAGNPDADTNDGTRGYALMSEFADLLRKYGTAEWTEAVAAFRIVVPSLAEKLARTRQLTRQKVTLSDGSILEFAPGRHNKLQLAVIREFLERYGYDAELLYVGDATHRLLYVNRERLHELSLPEPKRGDLPDIVAYSRGKQWVYLIEAVHASGSITEERLVEFQRLTKNCTVPIVYVTAFLDRAAYRKCAAKIAWETEVWIASHPDHLIHFNGHRFMGPYTSQEPR